MTIELPAELTEPLSWLGLSWPEADEDRLHADGLAWIEHATRLRRHAAEADTAARRVWLENEGASVDAFEQWWNGDDGPGRHLDDAATAVELIGAGLIAMAGLTTALKTAYIAQLTLLAFQVGQAVATSVVSAGATLAEIPVFVAASRLACRQLLHRALQVVEGEIADVFLQAATLLRTAGTRAAAQHAGQLARHFGQNSEFHRLMREVERADVRSPVNGANFYSGKLEDGTRMREIAEKNTDGVTSVTLEQTPGGARFDDMLLFENHSPIRSKQAEDIWGRLSERYAEGAQGDVTAWSHNPRVNSIWNTVEKPALDRNPAVTNISVIDPEA
ncbi:WXG100-like domain-containing protein [Actinoplanes subglobosus]|uniref:Outer membrane channel protein CpnT-like N-terminal domain-containing protein n=1 Tax=Actinoplanes subglobosus TaxID=1547892 RepID=A0ABV8IXN9_9ACTN